MSIADPFLGTKFGPPDNRHPFAGQWRELRFLHFAELHQAHTTFTGPSKIHSSYIKRVPCETLVRAAGDQFRFPTNLWIAMTMLSPPSSSSAALAALLHDKP